MSAAFVALALCCLATTSSGTAIARASASVHHRGRRPGGPASSVRGPELRHRLRVCNAYAAPAALEILRGRGGKLTSDHAMDYKDCRDFVAPLKAGDTLEFKVGHNQTGSFSVSDLPSHDALLLLVVHRHDAASAAMSFESHIFANLLNAQVAVIDAYKGQSTALPRIRDAANRARSEELRFDSVVAVNPGTYEVDLKGSDGGTKANSALVALNRESYVILRVGADSASGEPHPEELVVFPRSQATALAHDGAEVGGRSPMRSLVRSVSAWLFGE